LRTDAEKQHVSLVKPFLHSCWTANTTSNSIKQPGWRFHPDGYGSAVSCVRQIKTVPQPVTDTGQSVWLVCWQKIEIGCRTARLPVVSRSWLPQQNN
jgi:hypothetical protein